MSSRRRTAAVALGALAVVALIVILVVVFLVRGESGVRSALDDAFNESIESARVSVDLEVRVDGIPQFEQPVRLRMNGPYRSGGDRQLPSLDWNVTLAGGGQSLTGKTVSTGDNAFVVFQGTAYEFGRDRVAQANRGIAADEQRAENQSLREFGVDPRSWLVDAREEGDATVAGVEVTRYAASLDVGRLVDDLGRVTRRAGNRIGGGAPPPQLTPEQRTQLTRVVRDPTFDVYVGNDDGKIRRVAVRAPFSVPPEGRAGAGGASGGALAFSIEFADVDEPQTITAPPNPRPISDLTQQLGALGGGAAGGAGGGAAPPSSSAPAPSAPAPSAPAPGGGQGAAPGGSGAGDADVQRYSQCVERAGGERRALERCSRLLR